VSVASPKLDAWQALRRWRKFGDENPGAFGITERLKFAGVSALARVMLLVLGATTRQSAHGDEAIRQDLLLGRTNALFVSWHNRLAGALTYHDLFGRRNMAYRLETIVSASRDGELLARMIRESGGGVIRGSSSREGVAALKQAMDRLRQGFNLFTVGDGPRGPRYEMKPGPILLAKMSGLPVYPFTWAGSRVAQLHRAWDQMMIPLPLSRVQYRFGPPLRVAPDAGPREIAAARRELEARLNELTRWADDNTRVAWQIPKPRPGEVLKRRSHQKINTRRV
jgi:lysophospholipid acyltransferase (LPLAT)-like uncharacterized protein